jgi:glycosyltransferase involved in cell wall biosynthesis
MTLTISMAAYRTREYIGQAVESILAQSFTDLRLVVVNDGDTPPPLPADERLVLLNLPENRGPYYCDAVVLAACDTEWFTIHASDDWSNPDRFARLMAAAEGYETVWGGSIYIRRSRATVRGTDFGSASTSDVLLNRGSIATGIYRTEAIRRTGAPHPEYRMSYDTMMVHLICRGTRWTQVDDGNGYQRRWRPDSLTQAPETGMHSDVRNEYRQRRDDLWRRVIAAPQAAWPALLAPSAAIAASVERDADKLRELLAWRAAA